MKFAGKIATGILSAGDIKVGATKGIIITTA